MNPAEKTWQTPQLVVLARGTPEEAVLVACKNNNNLGDTLDYGGCGRKVQSRLCAGPCNAEGAS